MGHFDDGVQVHGYANAFNEMQLPVRSLARPTPTLPWIRLVFELQGSCGCAIPVPGRW
jgi:hypothetical protein